MSSRHAFVTGGSGYLGCILVERLLADGWTVVSIDLKPPVIRHPNLYSKQGDVREHDDLRELLDRHHYDAIYHLAAVLSTADADKKQLLSVNVEGTRRVAEFARYHGVTHFIYISSIALWARSPGHPIREDDAPCPVDLYGKSKWEAEKILGEFATEMAVVILRCPTVVGEGRLGLLGILFAFFQEGHRIWVAGNGRNRHPFVYGNDVVEATLLASAHPHSATFHLASNDTSSIKETYTKMIEMARSRSRVASLPRMLIQMLMRIASVLRLAPFSARHVNAIAEDLCFDSTAAKRDLGWTPTLSNAEMIYRAYAYYCQHRGEIESRRNVSANRKPAGMGVIAMLKWFS